MTTSTAATARSGPPTRVSGRSAGIAVAVVLIASFMDLLDATIVSVAAPAIAADLGASPTALQWTIAGYTLAIGAGLITGGRIGDQLGRRRVFLAGLAAFGITSALAALAPTAELLILARVLQGLAAGVMIPQVFGIIRSSLSPATMGKAFGAYGAVQGLAAIAGPLLGGGLVDADLFGLGVITVIGFVAWERRMLRTGGAPILDPGLFRVRAFSAGLAASALFFGGIGSFFFLLSLYLQLGTGRSAWETGLVTLPYAIGSLVASGLGIQLATRAGRSVLVAGSLLVALSHGVMWWVVRDGADSGLWTVAVPLFIGGLGLGLAAPSLVNVILAGVPGRNAGAAGGALSTVTQIGGATGVAVLGSLFFATLADGVAAGSTPRGSYADAFASILPWQVVVYLLVAVLLRALPKSQDPADSERRS